MQNRDFFSQGVSQRWNSPNSTTDCHKNNEKIKMRILPPFPHRRRETYTHMHTDSMSDTEKGS